MHYVVVTGASGGIGGVLTRRLLQDGYKVIAAVRDPRKVAELQSTDADENIVAVQLDLADPQSIRQCVSEIEKIVGTGGLAGLVNVAGLIVEGPLEALPPEELAYQMQVNVLGPFALTQALLPALKRGRGRIVNIGAISAHITVPFYGAIAASKSALASLTDAMRLELAPQGILACLIEPGAMATSIFATSRARRDRTLARMPELERHYRTALSAMDRAFEKAGADDPSVVADAILAALRASRPKLRVVVGKGTGVLMFLARLPIRLRDRIVRGILGLSAHLKPAK